MIIEEIKLENLTTRQAFYNVRIEFDNTSKKQYSVHVFWGKLGTLGKNAIKKRCLSLNSARFEMHKLVELKKNRHYFESNKTSEEVIQNKPIQLNSPEARRFLDLELE